MVGIEYPEEKDRDSLRTDKERSLLSPPDDYESDISIEELVAVDEE